MKRPAAIPFPSPANSPARAGRDHGKYSNGTERPKSRESYRTVPLLVEVMDFSSYETTN
jgi:hypothetical protein|tara:strand:- start:551 stop:727 length:177 start_codon:yes stop_codon:yes gene_type:complete